MYKVNIPYKKPAASNKAASLLIGMVQGGGQQGGGGGGGGCENTGAELSTPSITKRTPIKYFFIIQLLPAKVIEICLIVKPLGNNSIIGLHSNNVYLPVNKRDIYRVFVSIGSYITACFLSNNIIY